MRVTMNMMYGNVVRYLNANNQKYYQIQEKLLTEKNINRPSDDPVSTTQALDLRTVISKFGQYDRNIANAETYASQTEVALSNVVEQLQRALELTTDINDSLSGSAEYAAAAEELQGIFEEVLRSANTKIDNRYIFSGYETATKPFDATGNYSGGLSGQNIEVEIANDEFLKINYTGDDIFKNGTDVMQVLQDTITAVQSGNQTNISAQLPELQAALDQILVYSTANGTLTNRIEVAKEGNLELQNAYTSILSDVEDLDLVEVTSQFAQIQQVLEANQLVAAKMMETNLLDFLA